MAASDKAEAEIVEVVEQVLDNQMALVCIVGGAVLGAIALYAFNEWQKVQHAALRPSAPIVQLDPTDDRPDTIEPIPEFAQGGFGY